MSRQSFFQGALILTIAGLLSRVIGAISRIPLTRLIGSEGIGLFEMAYPVYGLMLVMSTAGIPVAISKLVAEKVAEGDRNGVQKVFRLALAILSISGFVFSLLLWFKARYLAENVLGDPRSYYSILAIAPAVFLVSVMSAFRGFFQGLQVMTPTAVSQVTEQMMRAVTMVGLAVVLLPLGLPRAAAGAAFGATTGAVLGLVVLIIIYGRNKGKLLQTIPQRCQNSDSRGALARRIVTLSVPITLGFLAKPMMHLINAVIVPCRLQAAGFSVAMSTALYGQLTGMALVLIEFPTIFTTSLASSLVPAISEAQAKHNVTLIGDRVQQALRLTLFLGLPSFVGLYTLAPQICEFLFGVREAGIPLRYLSIAVLFTCLGETTGGILNGLGKTILPAKNLLIGVAINVVISYWLTALPEYGIKGAAMGTAIGFSIAALLNLWYVIRYTGKIPQLTHILIKPGIAVVGMQIGVTKCYSWLFAQSASNTLSTLGSVMAGMLIYGVVLLILGGISKQDLQLISLIKGNK